MAIIWVVYLIQYAKEKALPAFAKYTGLVALAGVLAIGPNIANIWSTKVYTSESMRGGKSELTQKHQIFSWLPRSPSPKSLYTATFIRAISCC